MSGTLEKFKRAFRNDPRRVEKATAALDMLERQEAGLRAFAPAPVLDVGEVVTRGRAARQAPMPGPEGPPLPVPPPEPALQPVVEPPPAPVPPRGGAAPRPLTELERRRQQQEEAKKAEEAREIARIDALRNAEIARFGQQAADLTLNATELRNKFAAAKDGNTTATHTELGDVKQQARALQAKVVEVNHHKGMMRAIPAMFSQTEETLKDGGSDPALRPLKARLDALKARFGPMSDETPKADLDALEKDGRKLIGDIVKMVYPARSHGDEAPRKAAGIYKKMIEERYLFKVEDNTPGLDQMYDSLNLVPAEHVIHTSLKNVKVLDQASDGLGDYDSKEAKRMRVNAAISKTNPKIEYALGSFKGEVDTFQVTTLHEIGHSIDDKMGIMADPSPDNVGGWKEETEDTVAEAYLWAALPRITPDDWEVLLPQFKAVVGGGATAKPDPVSAETWAVADAALTRLKALVDDKKPWNSPKPVGDRVFQQAYPGKWNSYSMAARRKMLVRNYQWRAPGEWFAELYAASWMLKKTPSNVPPSAAIYMYQGK